MAASAQRQDGRQITAVTVRVAHRLRQRQWRRWRQRSGHPPDGLRSAAGGGRRRRPASSRRQACTWARCLSWSATALHSVGRWVQGLDSRKAPGDGTRPVLDATQTCTCCAQSCVSTAAAHVCRACASLPPRASRQSWRTCKALCYSPEVHCRESGLSHVCKGYKGVSGCEHDPLTASRSMCVCLAVLSTMLPRGGIAHGICLA